MVNSQHQTNIKVIIPSLFRKFTNNEEVISMVASTIKESMKVLTDRFPDLKKKLYDEKGDIAWGHQIRSYVLQPYTMIKDLRTGAETGKAQSFLDGEIDDFLTSYLKWKIGK